MRTITPSFSFSPVLIASTHTLLGMISKNERSQASLPGCSRVHHILSGRLEFFGAPVKREIRVDAGSAEQPETALLPCPDPAMHCYRYTEPVRSCGAQKAPTGSARCGRVRSGSRSYKSNYLAGPRCSPRSLDLPLHGSPILIGFLFAVGLPLDYLPGHFRIDLRLSERSGNFELEHLFVLAPVDDKTKLDEIESGELGDVENDLGILPTQRAGAVTRVTGPSSITVDETSVGRPISRRKRADAMRPGIASVG